MARLVLWSRFLVVPLALFLSTCGGESEPTDTTRNLTIQGGDNQSAAAGTAVATPPSVKVGNTSGTGVSGVAVTFAVASGGGTITGSSQTTNAQGIATVGGWTLGQAVGPNTLTVTVQGSSSTVTINATAAAGPAATLAKTAGDNQNATVKAAVATQPAVRVNDQFGNPVTGATVVFTVTAGAGTVTGGTQTTNAQGTATVGSWVLGPTNGVNRLSAAVQGVAAIQPQVFTANGQEIVLQPAADTTFQGGTINVTRLVIAAGRTVTLAGDVIINADSTVEIAGTITGNCRALTLNGAQAVSVSGAISNVCAVASDNPPGIRIVAKGGYTFTGAGAIVTSGDSEVTNDPTLTDANFPASPQASLRSAATPAARLNHVPCHVQKAFRVADYVGDAGNGAPGGPRGGDGKNGRGWTLQCAGADLDLGAGAEVGGQHAGDGGNALDTGNPGDAEGGDGGRGGNIKVRSTGRVVFSAAVTVRSGDGGDGGSAVANGTASVGGQRAAGAKAVGGPGGQPGLVEVRGLQGIVGAGNLRVQLGNAGSGGSGTATGANGEQGKAPDGDREQDGGNADATGGKGADTPDKQLIQSGNVAGGPPALEGGTAGNGGATVATGGRGADGTEAKIHGGHGGNIHSAAGNGGNALAKGLTGAPFGTGGNGGKANFLNARGADGWDNCIDPERPAGDGGNGGNATGKDGAGGTGATDGTPGGPVYANNSNGGTGGDHFTTPGDGGGAGSKTVTENGAVTTVDPAFQAGPPGNLCPALISADQLQITVTHIVFESPCPQLMAVLRVTNVSDVPVTLSRLVVGTIVVTVSGGQNVTLQPNQHVDMQLSFNCLQAFSFTGILRVTATPIQASPPAGARAAALALEPQVLDIPLTGIVRMRAVRLAQALGGFTSGSLIQQSRITNWLFFSAHPPNCATDHLHSTVPSGILIDGQGPFADPNQTGCGYGAVELATLPPAPAPPASVKAARRPRAQ